MLGPLELGGAVVVSGEGSAFTVQLKYGNG